MTVSFLEMFGEHDLHPKWEDKDAMIRGDRPMGARPTLADCATRPLADWLAASVRRIEAEEAQRGSFAGVDFSACQRIPVGEAWEMMRPPKGALMSPVIGGSMGVGLDGTVRITQYFSSGDLERAFEQSMERFREIKARPESTAKPALSGLTQVAGEKVRGIGWCDQ